jgi:superfamily II DNA or RNA helicase
VRLIVANRLTVQDAPPALERELCQRLTVPNPKHVGAVKAGRYAGHLPERLAYHARTADGLVGPRGAEAIVRSMAREHECHLEVVDRSRVLPEVDVSFCGELRPYQADALKRVTRWPSAVLRAPTGSGKTVMALAAIAQRRQPALVVVHTGTLADQWVSRAETFLGIPAAEVGRIGGGRCELGDRLTVAVINSLAKHAQVVAPQVGHLVVDEAHRVAGRRYARTVGAFDARYRLGLSATPWRSDGLTDVVSWILGPTCKVDRAPLVEAGAVLPAEVSVRETAFRSTCDASGQYQAALGELVEDPDRNAMIAQDVAQAVADEPGLALVLTDRRAHCEALQGALAARNVPAVVMTGELTQREREAALGAVRAGKARVIVATAQLVGEGFDLPEIGAVFMATPVKFDGRVLQLVGRALRPAPGKVRATVVDYVDREEPVFAASARARQKIYAAEVAA